MHLKNFIPLLTLNTSVFKPETRLPINIGQKAASGSRLKGDFFTISLTCDIADRHGVPYTNIVNSPESVNS